MTFCAVRIVEGKIFIIETMYTVIFKKKMFLWSEQYIVYFENQGKQSILYSVGDLNIIYSTLMHKIHPWHKYRKHISVGMKKRLKINHSIS